MTPPAHPVWRPAPWLAGSLAVVFAAGGLPLVWLALAAAGETPALWAALASTRTLSLLTSTALLGAVVSLLSGAAGTVLGLLITKTDLPGRSLLAALVTFPLFLPPFILALGWFSVLGREGMLPASAFLFGLGGAVLVLTTAYTPIAMHLVRIALRSIDPRVEEAARLRVRWPAVVRRIDLPLIGPAVALAMLLTFILVAGELGVPAYLRYPVFSSEVFTQFAAFLNIHAAVAMSIPLTLLILAGLAVERYWLRDRIRPLTRVHASNQARIPLGRWRAPATAAAWAYAAFTVVAPIVGLMVRARGWASYATAVRGAGASIVRSVWTAGAAATVMVALGLLLAYLVERQGRRPHDGLDTLLLLLFAAPGTVLGIGLILLWNRAGLGWLYGSAAVILVGYVGHFTPLAARVLGVALRSLGPGVEEAARVAGISWTRALRRVLVPPIRQALAAAWFLTFVFCLRDLDLAVTIYPPGAETLPVRVYTLMANSPEPVTAALALTMIGLTALILSVAMAASAAFRSWSRAWS